MTWEEAVKQLRTHPENEQSLLDNYFDADIIRSAERFYQSEEFTALKAFIPSHAKTLLDIGAGRGIASFAFAKSGLQVSALEPDPSNDVGSGAIKLLAKHFQLPITITESFGEQLPYADNSFDMVYARQVLHHANDLTQFCKEAARVLKPGGVFIATREHVLSKESDLDTFLANHPLHKHYGGEHAFTLKQYLDAIKSGGLHLTKVLHPYASVINYAPLSEKELKQQFSKTLSKAVGKSVAHRVIQNETLFTFIKDLKAARFHQPGRLYSFIATKK